MKIILIGNRQVAIIGLLTLKSIQHYVKCVVSYFDKLDSIVDRFKIMRYKSIFDEGFDVELSNSDVLFSMHATEILPNDMLKLPRLGCVNFHPYLYQYKNTHPVSRAFNDKNFRASIGVHYMSETVDCGDLILEHYYDVSGSTSVVDIYNMLYCEYPLIIAETIDYLEGK